MVQREVRIKCQNCGAEYLWTEPFDLKEEFCFQCESIGTLKEVGLIAVC